MAWSSSGLGHRPLKAKIGGSNPLQATTNLQKLSLEGFFFIPRRFVGRFPIVSGANPDRIVPRPGRIRARTSRKTALFHARRMPISARFLSIGPIREKPRHAIDAIMDAVFR